MARRLGMDPAQVENTAARISAGLASLEGAAHTTSMAALASLNPLSYGIQPGGVVIAPFAITGTQVAAAKVRSAAAEARALASGLLREASEQRVASGGGGRSWQFGPLVRKPGERRPDGPDWWGIGDGVWSGFEFLRDVSELGKGIAGFGFVAARVRDMTSLNAMSKAMYFSSTFKAFDGVNKVLSLGKAAPILGGIGIALDGIGTVSALSRGEWGEAIWSGAKTALSVAAVFAPPPVNLACGAVRAAIGIGEFVHENWDTISNVAGNVGNAIGGFVGGVAETVGKLWPW